jgi:hypothetical protein
MSIAMVVDGEWRLGIGGPAFRGWATAASYFVAAVLCFRAMRRSKASLAHTSHKPLFWLLVGLLLVFLGINRQLDLQSWLTLEGRAIAQTHGWYAQRRPVQEVFMIGIASAGLFFAIVLVRVLWGAPRTYKMATVGLAFLTCFVLIRAASFHEVDQFVGWRIEGAKLNWLLESGGILCVAISAFSIRKSPTEKQRRSSPNGARARTGPKAIPGTPEDSKNSRFRKNDS